MAILNDASTLRYTDRPLSVYCPDRRKHRIAVSFNHREDISRDSRGESYETIPLQFFWHKVETLGRNRSLPLYLWGLMALCSAESSPGLRSGSLPKDEPQAVYHSDPADPGSETIDPSEV
jgi:hypothetical protein